MNVAPITVLRAVGVRFAVFVVTCLMVAGCGSGTPATSTPLPATAPVSTAKFAYVANNHDNTISMYTVSSIGQWTPTFPATVATGVQPAVVVADSQGKFAYVSNIRDATIGEYAINQTTGVLAPLSPATAASGLLPQDFTLHPSGNFAYSANTNDDTITVFSVNKSSGQLTPTATVKVPGYAVADPVAVTVDPAGKFLYVVAQYVEIYSIDAVTGNLSVLPEKYISGGLRPFKLAFDPTGQFAYIPDNDNPAVYEFTVNRSTGALTAVTGGPAAVGAAPAWVAVDPTGKFAYVSNRIGNTLSAFNLTASTGLLTQMATGLPNGYIDSTNYPWELLFDPSGQIAYVLGEGGIVTSYATHPNGVLTYLGTVKTGNTPWSFAIVPAP